MTGDTLNVFHLAISRAWLNTLIATIPKLPKDAIKREVKY